MGRHIWQSHGVYGIDETKTEKDNNFAHLEDPGTSICI